VNVTQSELQSPAGRTDPAGRSAWPAAAGPGQDRERTEGGARSGQSAPRRDNLPLQLTSFVGRERELAAVTDLLAAHRLLTLTGPGGVGKTRLALQAAASGRDTFAGGAWAADLAPLAEPGRVPAAVATALGLALEPGLPLAAQVIDALRAEEALLVLDNCEHLVDACARLADALLRGCPGIRVLGHQLRGAGRRGHRRGSRGILPPEPMGGAFGSSVRPTGCEPTSSGPGARWPPGWSSGRIASGADERGGPRRCGGER
jgi:hypothetical protein